MDFPLLDWARRFVATPSVSRDGNVAMSERAAELLESVGLAPRFDEVCLDGARHRNVIANLGPPVGSAPGVLLVTHLDTVPPGDTAAWTATGGDPFRPTLDGDRLYGLGSADAKVDLVCKAGALATLVGAELRRPVRIVGTFAEEIGLRGARHLLDSGGACGFSQALVGEPSELTAIRAHKGYAVFEASLPPSAERVQEASRPPQLLEGAAAHSSTPHLGGNAIEMALDRLAALGARAVEDLSGGGAVNQVPDRCTLAVGSGYPAEPLHAFHRAWRDLLARLATRRDPNFDPDHTVGSIGRVEMREGRPVFSFDLRPVPGGDPLEAVAPLAAVAELRMVRYNPPLDTPEDGALVGAVASAQESLGIGRRVATKATCTEAGLLSAAGLEAVVIGAGVSVGNVHRPNEHTSVAQLHQMRDLYAETLRRLVAAEAA